MLVIENGNGISNANSYISLADARLKATDYGIKLPADDTEAETALRQGYLNLNVEENYYKAIDATSNKLAHFLVLE